MTPDLRSYRQLVLVAAKLMDLRSMGLENLRYEQAQLAVSKHGDRRLLRNGDLIEDLASRRERLHKDSVFVWD